MLIGRHQKLVLLRTLFYIVQGRYFVKISLFASMSYWMTMYLLYVLSYQLSSVLITYKVSKLSIFAPTNCFMRATRLQRPFHGSRYVFHVHKGQY